MGYRDPISHHDALDDPVQREVQPLPQILEDLLLDPLLPLGEPAARPIDPLFIRPEVAVGPLVNPPMSGQVARRLVEPVDREEGRRPLNVITEVPSAKESEGYYGFIR